MFPYWGLYLRKKMPLARRGKLEEEEEEK